MSVCGRRAAALVTTVLMAVALAACGNAGEDSGGGASRKIGLLLPGNGGGRAGKFDKPLTVQKIKKLCSNCTVEYANAHENVATQQQQVDTMLTKGVDVLIVDPVDATSLRSSVKRAKEADVPVIAYDRLAEGPVAGFVSFDGVGVGKAQGRGLLKAMGDKADGGQIVMMNGAPTDPNAAQFKKGALSVLKNRVKIAKAYDTAEWRPVNAQTNMSAAISELGADNIDGVYAANDGLASGVITALKAASIKPLPPVTGQDADLSAVQRIVSGEQNMSVYKPFALEADAAAKMAVALARGKNLEGIAQDRISSPTTKGVPAILLAPVPLTVDNIKDTVVKDGMHTIDQICTPKFKPACQKAGLTP